LDEVGVGVAGSASRGSLGALEAGAGAAGGATGVEIIAAAGVLGGAAEAVEAAADELLGTTLGYMASARAFGHGIQAYPLNHTDNEAFLLDLVRLNSVAIL
jgi:hypothetical protein